MAKLIREFDWSKTPLGAIENWSDSLLVVVNLLLYSPVPTQLLWGPEYIILYNDMFMAQLNDKHPDALGQRGDKVWFAVWDQVVGTLDSTLQRGEVHSFRKSLVPIDVRSGGIEDSYWNYSYSPVFQADGSIGGVLNISKRKTGYTAPNSRNPSTTTTPLVQLNSRHNAVVEAFNLE